MDRARASIPAASATPEALDHLLQVSSRTFALTIPLLDEPTRCEVTVAYLLFRVADTFEDATLWPAERKLSELERLARFLEEPASKETGTLAAGWMAQPPTNHTGYLHLLSEFPAVMRTAALLSPRAWNLISTHTARTCRAMEAFVARSDHGELRLRDMADLSSYCYAVAGIVGEMLTELFLLPRGGLDAIASKMREDAAAFGQALQLVNILKDSAADATEGRCYLPRDIERTEVFSLAKSSLQIAARYCIRLERAAARRGLLAFTALPVLLAQATLSRVEQLGPGAKITRAEVARIVADLKGALRTRKVEALLMQATS